jgi:hypothetical protein
LEPNVIYGLINYISIQTNLTNSAKSFYNSLNLDDISYFTGLLLFENENIFCCLASQEIELNFLVAQLLMLPNMWLEATNSNLFLILILILLYWSYKQISELIYQQLLVGQISFTI